MQADGVDAAFPAAETPGAIGALAHVSPPDLAKRRTVKLNGIQAELLQAPAKGRIDLHFSAPRHLLIAYEQGARREGETNLEGLPPTSRHDLARKLTFVPAGHTFREWHAPRAPLDLMFVHFDPGAIQVRALANGTMSPRLFFEDATLWATVAKLKSLLAGPGDVNHLYLDAVATVLVHELTRSNRGAERVEPQVRGGLAAWQQRVVAAYIEEHLAEQIPLATLAALARLSPYHFCRAFKQSFGVPPHRYHTNRRIERAKVLLEERPVSVTQIGLALGFSETSSFSAAFRRATGQTPSGYHRSIA